MPQEFWEYKAPDGTVIAVRIMRLHKIEDVEPNWRQLEKLSEPSSFLSWSWIQCWLREIDYEPSLIIAKVGEQIVGLGLITHRQERRHFFNCPSLYLHQTGDKEADSVFTEFNGFLLHKKFRETATQAILDALLNLEKFSSSLPNWIEFHIAGAPSWYLDLIKKSGLGFRIIAERPSPYVKLVNDYADIDSYLATLSSNTRYQIRRSIKLYEKIGPLNLAALDGAEQATEWLEEMKRLNLARWAEADSIGGFKNAFFNRFVTRLLNQSLEEKFAEVMRVSAGNHGIGYLYNLVHGDVASSYQSGFVTPENNHYKPGLVSHALAISHYAARGLKKYSFLAGQGQYKSSLSDSSESLYWIVLQKENVILSTENLVRSLVNRIRKK